MQMIELTREYQDLVMFYTDSGMSLKEAEITARNDIKQALVSK